MNIIDVTLRDGGHAVNFDWPINFARDYYRLISSFKDVNFIELGYWKQLSKSNKDYYTLDIDKVNNVTQKAGLKNVAIMIDYHYCSHILSDYPTVEQSEISLIRLCSRKEDLKNAIEFGEKLKAYTGLLVSLNIFNTSNYSEDELLSVSKLVSISKFDYIYFADTHGSINLKYDSKKFIDAIKILSKANKKIGLHLHDHSGLAYYNYQKLFDMNIDFTDTSLRGMGKGSGNLKLEFIINKSDLIDLSQLILNYNNLLTITPTPYELISAKYSVSDNYANEAKRLNLTILQFDNFCKTLSNLDKDSYNKDLITFFLNE
jgi:4-hydroxy 2-oxovalerate aldolase